MFRIPKIEEFIEGFEFEVYMKSGGSSFGIMDFSKGNEQSEFSEQIHVNKQPTIEQWEKFTVPKQEIGAFPVIDWYFSFSINEYLKNNKIRTKI